MEIAKVEMEALEASLAVPNVECQKLSDLELAMVGGGMGDIVI